MKQAFTARRRLRFAHCDAAGIAYYPRYLEMADGVIEDWTEAVIGVARRELHLDRGLALPTAEMATRFTRPGRLGDWLDFALTVERIGTSSIELAIVVTSGEEPRFDVRYTQVLIEIAGMKPIPWPSEWRSRIQETMQ